MDDNKSTSLTVEQAFLLYQIAQRERIAAIIAESDALKTLARAAGTKTFCYEGQVYQVRVRANKELGAEMGYEDPKGYPLAFLCRWKKPPKESFADAKDRVMDQLTSEYETQQPSTATPARESLSGGTIQASELLGAETEDDGTIVLE